MMLNVMPDSMMVTDQEGEDEAALEVVQQEKPQQQNLGSRCLAAGSYPYTQHGQKGGCLHQHPSHLVIDAPAPLPGTELSVSGGNKIQADEDHQAQHHHTCQQVVEDFFCHVL